MEVNNRLVYEFCHASYCTRLKTWEAWFYHFWICNLIWCEISPKPDMLVESQTTEWTEVWSLMCPTLLLKNLIQQYQTFFPNINGPIMFEHNRRENGQRKICLVQQGNVRPQPLPLHDHLTSQSIRHLFDKSPTWTVRVKYVYSRTIEARN